MTGNSRRALLGLIVISGLLRLAWASTIGPGNDEAYHSLFAARPALSYFDHPPMLAWVELAGLAIGGGDVTTLNLRLGFVLLFAGSTWLMARLGARLYGERAGLFAAFALNATAYHTAAAGAFALPDGPLLFFWLLTLERLVVAMNLGADKDGSPVPGAWPWVGVGLAWGGALLSKYHGAFLPIGALATMLLVPPARAWLRKPGAYLAAAVGLAVFSPVLAWNARHGWASFLFQGARAVGENGFKPAYLVGALLGPLAYLFPWIWLRLVRILVGQGRKAFTPEVPASDRFLLAQTVAPLATFLAVACTRPVLPHWSLIGFIPLYPMLGRAMSLECETNPISFRRRAIFLAGFPVLLVGLIAWHARSGVLQLGGTGIGLVGPSSDPTVDLYGWDQVAVELKRRGLLDRGERMPFLFTADWYLSGQLAFATRASGTPVLCYHAWDARSFAFWDRPEEWVGRDGVLVAVNTRSTEPGRFDRWFESIEPIGEFDIKRGGAPVRTVRLFYCKRQTKSFPFDDLGRTVRPRSADERVAGRASATAR